MLAVNVLLSFINWKNERRSKTSIINLWMMFVTLYFLLECPKSDDSQEASQDKNRIALLHLYCIVNIASRRIIEGINRHLVWDSMSEQYSDVRLYLSSAWQSYLSVSWGEDFSTFFCRSCKGTSDLWQCLRLRRPDPGQTSWALWSWYPGGAPSSPSCSDCRDQPPAEMTSATQVYVLCLSFTKTSLEWKEKHDIIRHHLFTIFHLFCFHCWIGSIA